MHANCNDITENSVQAYVWPNLSVVPGNEPDNDLWDNLHRSIAGPQNLKAQRSAEN